MVINSMGSPGVSKLLKQSNKMTLFLVESRQAEACRQYICAVNADACK